MPSPITQLCFELETCDFAGKQTFSPEKTKQKYKNILHRGHVNRIKIEQWKILL